MNKERFFGITTDFNDWKTEVERLVNAMNEPEGYRHKAIFLGCFKMFDLYLKIPIAIVEYNAVMAKSMKVKSDQEVIDFINDNPTIIPYMYFETVNRKVFRYTIPERIENE